MHEVGERDCGDEQGFEAAAGDFGRGDIEGDLGGAEHAVDFEPCPGVLALVALEGGGAGCAHWEEGGGVCFGFGISVLI